MINMSLYSQYCLAGDSVLLPHPNRLVELSQHFSLFHTNPHVVHLYIKLFKDFKIKLESIKFTAMWVEMMISNKLKNRQLKYCNRSK
jgi:hypothetical protein